MLMRWPVASSTVLHVLVVVVAYVGLPHIRRDTPPTETPIMVEIARISEVTNPPPPAPLPKEEPKQKPEEAKPPPPPPPPKPQAAPPPPPPPQPSAPEPKVAAIPPEPEPKPKAKEKPPEPEAKPKPAAVPSPVLNNAKPKRKPQPPDQFASVLKTLEQLKQQPKPDKPDPKAKPKDEKKDQFENQIAKALQNPSRPNDPTRELSMSVIDLLRQQIRKCWNVTAGAKDAHNMTVEIEVTMNQDGTVRRAEIRNTMRIGVDPFYQAFAESARRAVLNPQCQPYKLPPDKYDQWRDLVLNFDPREML